MRKLFLFLMVLAFLGVPILAQADFTFSDIEGSWDNVVGGSGITFPSDVPISYGNGLEDQVRWGTPSGGKADEKSGLGFTGNAGNGVDLTVNANTIFDLGQIRHFNFPILSGTQATSADLTIDMLYSDPSGVTETISLTMGINETPNNTGDPNLDADIITFPTTYPPTTYFMSGGTQYVLTLLGFGQTAGFSDPNMISPEGGSNYSFLWADITTVPVPEPASMGLLAAGLVSMGFWGFRRKKQNQN